jgi:alpha-tubulin suppressor-like RCC1 family protein
MTKRLITSIVLLFVLSNAYISMAQNYYWVGGTGNWTDTSHWSNISGGVGGSYFAPPTSASRVFFDTNSFSGIGQTVTIDTSNITIKAMSWKTSLDGNFDMPTFVGLSTDSITVKGSLFLDDFMNYAFNGKFFMTAGAMDTLYTGNNLILNDFQISHFDSLIILQDNFNSLGGLIFNRGGFKVSNRTINARFFKSRKSNPRNLILDNAIFNLAGNDTVLYINPTYLTRSGTNEVFNILNPTIDTVKIFMGKNSLQWHRLNLNNKHTHFISGANFNTIQSTTSESIRLKYNDTLKVPNFLVAGNCGSYLHLYCKEGVAKISGLGTPLSINYASLKNISGLPSSTYTATNSFNLGGNTAWTITEDPGVNTYYWVGGSGSFYDPSMWSTMSGGTSGLCFPGPNDIAIFDANSILADTVYIQQKIIIGRLDFSTIPSTIVLSGDPSYAIEVRENLIGSNFIDFDWQGNILLTASSGSTSITSNGLSWNCNLIKTGAATLSFADSFTSLKNFSHTNGTLLGNSVAINFWNFYADSTANIRNINFGTSLVNVAGVSFKIGATTIGTFIAPTELKFQNVNGNYVNFTSGSHNYNVVRIQTSNIDFIVDNTTQSVSLTLLDINAGTTVILQNGSSYICDSINAVGTCVDLITIKTSSSTGTTALITKTANVNTVIDYLIIDNVDAAGIGNYFANYSTILNGSANWILSNGFATLTIPFGAMSVDSNSTQTLTGSISGFDPVTVLSSTLYLNGLNTTNSTDLDSVTYELSAVTGGPGPILAMDSLNGTGDQAGVNFSFPTSTPNNNTTLNLVLSNLNDSGNVVLTDSYITINYMLQPTLLSPMTYYWIGNGGDWSDTAHWSTTSGVATYVNCAPSISDNVIFDNNSFSSINEIVTVDKEVYISSMNWIITDQDSAILLLDKSMTFIGDVSLNDQVFVTRNNKVTKMIFQPDGVKTFNTLNAKVDVQVVLLSDNVGNELQLSSNLIMTDSTNIIVGGGSLNTMDYNITTGTIYFGSPTAKSTDLGSSIINLRYGFNDESIGSSLILDADSCTININFDNGIDSVYDNYFISTGHVFNDVVLNFNFDKFSDFTGNNTFKNLTIGQGSKLKVKAGDVTTVANLFTAIGTCKDSIYFKSSNPGTQFVIDKTNSPSTIECVNMTDAQSTDQIITANYSTNTNNSSIGAFLFPSTPAANAIISSISNYCLGDTLQFTNGSTATSGSPTFIWTFDDGTELNGDTTQHYFGFPGDYTIGLTAINANECSNKLDTTISILDPSVILNSSLVLDTTICAGESVTFIANPNPDTSSITYQFYINSVPNVTNDTLTTTTINNLDTIYVEIMQDACPARSNQFVFKVNPLPIPSLTTNNSNVICDGDSVTLVATGDSIYQYYKNGAAYTAFSSTPSLSMIDVVDGDSFFVVVKNPATGCEINSDTITYTVNALPTVSIDDNDPTTNTICQGDSVTINSTTGIPGNITGYSYIVNDSSWALNTSPTYATSLLNDGDILNVVVSDVNGCYSDTSNSILYTVNAIPTISVSADTNSFCEGETVTFTATGGTTYQFTINGSEVLPMSGQSYFISSAISNGDQIVVNGVGNNCPNSSAPLLMNVLPLPITSLTSNIGTTICSSQMPQFTASSALATSFEFLVNGVTVQAESALATYTPASTLPDGAIVSVVGYQGSCTHEAFLTMTVNQSPVPTIYTNDIDNSICSNGSITIDATGGSTYQFYLNGSPYGTPAGSSVIINGTTFLAGNNIIFVNVIGANSCITPTSLLNIEMVNTPAVTMTSSAVLNTVCQGIPVTFMASTNAANYQFFLNGTSLGLPSALNTYTSSSLGNGSVITLVGYNGSCSQSSADTITTTVIANPVANIAGTTVFCQGTNALFEGAQGNQYEFIIDGSSLGISADSMFNASSLTAGNHILGLNVFQNGCTASASQNITVLSLPVATLTGNSTICSGQTASFVASGASLYKFFVNGIDFSGGFFASPNFSGTFNNGDVISVIGKNLASCPSVNVNAITLTVNPTPIVSITSSDPLNDSITCTNDLLDFTASGATSFQFFVNGVSQGASSTTSIFSTSSLTNGQTVSVVGSSLGCTNQASYGPFLVSTYPVVQLINNDDSTLCVGENSNLTATGSSNYLFFINGLPQGTFSAISNFNSTLNNGDVISVQGVTNTCVANGLQTVTYQVFNYPVTTLSSSASPTNNVICFGDTVTFTGGGAMDYEYFVDGISIPSVNGVVSLANIENGQVITLTGSNNQCPTPAPNPITFTVNTMDIQTQVTPSNYILCSGEDLLLTATGSDNYSILINGMAPAINSSTGNFVISNLTAGDFIVLTGSNNTTGCVQLDDETIYVQVNNPVDFTIDGNQVFCEGDSAILMSNALNGNQWLLNGNPIAGATNQTYVVFSTGDYSLQTSFGGNKDLWSFGNNSNGEFGNGANFNSSIPLEAIGITDLLKVETGYGHLIGINNSGLVYSWGDNSSGQLGKGTYTSSNNPAQVISLPTSIDVNAGDDFSMAVSSTGNLYAWGGNNSGQLGLNNIITYNTPQLVATVNNVDKVACGKYHSLILKSNGTVLASGNNNYGQLGSGNLNSSSIFIPVAGLTNIVQIQAGDYHSMAIDNLGQLYVWGNNTNGQLGLNDLTNRMQPTLSPLENVKTCSGGNAHTLIVTTNGKVYASGKNDFGQLATSDLINRDSPTLIEEINAVAEVAAGGYHSLFRKIDGSIWGAGRNDNFQLGAIPPGAISTIERLVDLTGVTRMAAGTENSHFIYGNNTNCSSPISAINVSTAPQPIINLLVNQMITSTTGASYQWFINGIPIINSNSTSIDITANGYYSVAVTFANGCVRVSDELGFGVIGLEENQTTDFIVYPNPFSNRITIEGAVLSMHPTIYITDLQGRKIYELSIENQINKFTIDLSEFANGLYHLNIQDNKGNIVKTNIIKN